jgi:hypothetical protein
LKPSPTITYAVFGTYRKRRIASNVLPIVGGSQWSRASIPRLVVSPYAPLVKNMNSHRQCQPVCLARKRQESPKDE